MFKSVSFPYTYMKEEKQIIFLIGKGLAWVWYCCGLSDNGQTLVQIYLELDWMCLVHCKVSKWCNLPWVAQGLKNVGIKVVGAHILNIHNKTQISHSIHLLRAAMFIFLFYFFRPICWTSPAGTGKEVMMQSV